MRRSRRHPSAKHRVSRKTACHDCLLKQEFGASVRSVTKNALARGVALVKGNKLELPVSQLHIADTLGLSLVHTNKTLQKLRESGSIILDGRTLKIVDEQAL